MLPTLPIRFLGIKNRALNFKSPNRNQDAISIRTNIPKLKWILFIILIKLAPI